MAVRKILDTDKINSGFRTKYNETVDEIPTGFTDNGDGTAKIQKSGGGEIPVDLRNSFPLKSSTYSKTETDTNISASITALIDSVPLGGDTLRKLYESIQTLQSLLTSNDVNLDTVQEIVNYIKSEQSLIDTLSTNKVNKTDIVDNLLSNDGQRPLSANQGNVIKGLIDALAIVVGGKQANLGFTPEDSSKKGIANGYAGLGADGEIIKHTLYTRDNIALVCSDQSTDISASSTISKILYRVVQPFNLTNIIGGLREASVGGLFTVIVKKNGTSIFTTNLTFDSGEVSTVTAATQCVLTTNPISFAVDDYIEVFVTQVGSTSAGKGLIINLLTNKIS